MLELIWPPTPPLASNNRQRQVNFHQVLLFPSPFFPMSLSYISFFSNWTAMVLPWEHAKAQPTHWIIPSVLHHHLDNNNRQVWVYFCGEFSCPLDFLQMFHSYDTIFQFIIYDPTMGRAKTQPTDWVWLPTPPHFFANNNRQQQIYFCGEFHAP